MRPTGQCLHAIAPGANVFKLRADIEAELLHWIKEVASERDIDDARLIAQHERRLRKPLIDNPEIAVDAAFQKGQDRRIASRAREIFQEPVRSQEAVHFLIVEN